MNYKVGTTQGQKKSNDRKPLTINGIKLKGIEEKGDDIVVQLEGQKGDYELTLKDFPKSKKSVLEGNVGNYLMLHGEQDKNGNMRYTLAASKTQPVRATLMVLSSTLPITTDKGMTVGFTSGVEKRSGEAVFIKGDYDQNAKQYQYDRITGIDAIVQKAMEVGEKLHEYKNMGEEERENLTGKQIKEYQTQQNKSFIVYAKDQDGKLAMAPVTISPDYLYYKASQGEDPKEVLSKFMDKMLQNYGANLDDVVVEAVEGNKLTLSKSKFKKTDISGIQVHSPMPFEPVASVSNENRNNFTHYMVTPQLAVSKGFLNQSFGRFARPDNIAYALGLDGVSPSYDKAVSQVIEAEKAKRTDMKGQEASEHDAETPEVDEPEPEKKNAQQSAMMAPSF